MVLISTLCLFTLSEINQGVNKMKCLVKDCPNDSSEGVFIGELCGPCHDALANGCRQDFMRERLVPEFKRIKKLEEILFTIGEQLGYPYGDIDKDVPFDKTIAQLQTKLMQAEEEIKQYKETECFTPTTCSDNCSLVKELKEDVSQARQSLYEVVGQRNKLLSSGGGSCFVLDEFERMGNVIATQRQKIKNLEAKLSIY